VIQTKKLWEDFPEESWGGNEEVKGGLRGSPKAPVFHQFIYFTIFTKVNLCLLLLILVSLFDAIFELRDRSSR
jgi:hypothetical protein